jgi:glucose/arabinose dehydrogenase
MGRLLLVLGLALAAGGLLLPAPRARAQVVPDGFAVETLVPGLAAPVALEFLPDGRVLFTEQFTARVRVARPGVSLQATPLITVPGASVGGERGLLGVAVDPGFPARPYLYLFYTSSVPSAHVHLARFTLSGDLDGSGAGDLVADPASRFDLVADAPDQAGNHNGGTVRFGVEGLLYASLGEDAVPCAAQAPGTLRGVILRLRVGELPPGPGSAFRAQLTPPDNPFAASPDSNLRLVACFGLRNPFRLQVDPVFGTLAIGDVGDFQREELDLLQPPVPVPLGLRAPSAQLPPGGAAPLGANFGWPYLEGTAPGRFAGDCAPAPPGLVAPVHDYDRTGQAGGASIISAGFYRQRAGGSHNWPADHDGDLFANDYYSGVLRRLEDSGGTWSLAPPVAGQPTTTAWGTGFRQVSDWRVGPDGALWFCRQGVDFAPGTGSIGRIRGPGSLGVHPGGSPSLRLVRSPAVGSAELRVAATGPVRVRVLDVAGRTLRTLWDGAAPAGGEFPLAWDGRTGAGARVGPGIYLAFVESGGRTAAVRIPFLR